MPQSDLPTDVDLLAELNKVVRSSRLPGGSPAILRVDTKQLPTGTCDTLTPLATGFVNTDRVFIAQTYLGKIVFALDASPTGRPAGTWRPELEFSTHRGLLTAQVTRRTGHVAA